MKIKTVKLTPMQETSTSFYPTDSNKANTKESVPQPKSSTLAFIKQFARVCNFSTELGCGLSVIILN